MERGEKEKTAYRNVTFYGPYEKKEEEEEVGE